MVKPFGNQHLWMRRELPVSHRSKELSMWTTELYYKKYTHMVQIATANGDSDPVEWCKKNLPGSHKKRTHSLSRKQVNDRFYCNESGYNQLIEIFGDRVVDYSKPFNEVAEQQLRQGLTLELRDQLYYKKYRYSLYVRQGDLDIRDWYKSNLGVYKQDYFHTYGGTSLYLRTDESLLHVKLALSENIVFAKRAWLEDEVVKAIR